VERTTDSGANWVTVTNGVSGLGLNAVSCADAFNCIAVGGQMRGGHLNAANNFLVTTDGGATWTSGTLPNLNAYITSVSCVDPQHCWATTALGIGGTSTIIATSDGGGSWANLNWTTPPLPVGGTALVGAQLNAISCTSINDCLAVGQATYTTTLSPPLASQGVVSTTDNGGLSWHSQLVSATDLTSISCPHASECMAVALSSQSQSIDQLLSMDAGATWSVSTIASGNQIASGHAPRLNAISCFDSLSCFAVGVVFDSDEYETPITASTDGGATWSNQTAQPGDANLQSVACVTLSSCWAVGWTPRGSVIVHTVKGGTSSPTVTGIGPNHGPTGGGTSVTINGSGFSKLTLQVSFGSATTTNFTVNSDSQITVTLPPAMSIVQGTAAVVDVTVKTALGTSQLTPNDQFTYTG
jgi:hypothetical protein